MPHGAALLVCHACGIEVKRTVCHWWGMSREDLHFRLRIPEDLKATIEKAAEENHRSMTAEMVARLQASEEIPRILSDFELAKDRILSAQTLEKSLRDQVRILNAALMAAQESNGRLVQLIERRLNGSPDEIAAALKHSE